MTWPVDKFQVCVDSLTLTGNNVPNVPDDGSEEWDKASIAYESALPYALENGNWSFATSIVTLTKLPGAPSDNSFDSAYAKPADALHIVWVKLSDVPVNFRIVGNQIFLNASGNTAVTLKYVRQPTPDQASPNFMMALRAFTMSGIYRGFDDPAAADKQWAAGEGFLAQGRTRSDQEMPKRAVVNSRVTAARTRRLSRWPAGWGT
jgi:hypothetical protein